MRLLVLCLLIFSQMAFAEVPKEGAIHLDGKPARWLFDLFNSAQPATLPPEVRRRIDRFEGAVGTTHFGIMDDEYLIKESNTQPIFGCIATGNALAMDQPVTAPKSSVEAKEMECWMRGNISLTYLMEEKPFSVKRITFSGVAAGLIFDMLPGANNNPDPKSSILSKSYLSPYPGDGIQCVIDTKQAHEKSVTPGECWFTWR